MVIPLLANQDLMPMLHPPHYRKMPLCGMDVPKPHEAAIGKPQFMTLNYVEGKILAKVQMNQIQRAHF